MPETKFDIVIVGGGPRAVSIVERLIARADANARLDVAIVDAIEVGAGATWRTDQSPELLNNTYAAHTTVFPDDASPIPAPAIAGPDLMGWVDTVVGEARSGWIGEEARRLKPWSFPSRRLQGAYYREQLARLEAIGVVDVTGFDCTAVRFASDVGADRAQVVELSDGTLLEGRTVVLAQGMVQARPTGDIQTFIEAARRPGLTYIPPGMPAEQDWHRVPGGAPVIARGLGATFFDVFPLLTKERGGRFERVGDRLSYQPSGREPIIFAGSRRGLPYRSKAYYPDGFPPAYVPRFATREWFEDVARTPNQDFAESIWPQIARELAWAHASTAVEAGHVRLNVPLSAVEATLADIGPDGIDAYLASVIDDPVWRFVLGELDRPPAGRVFEASEWQTWVDVYVGRERASIIDPLTHPRNAVNRAMNAVRKTAAALAYRGAIDGYSTVRDIRGVVQLPRPLPVLGSAATPHPGVTRADQVRHREADRSSNAVRRIRFRICRVVAGRAAATNPRENAHRDADVEGKGEPDVRSSAEWTARRGKGAHFRVPERRRNRGCLGVHRGDGRFPARARRRQGGPARVRAWHPG